MSLTSDGRAATAVAERLAAAGERATATAPLLRAVTWRSLLVSVLLIPPNAYWLVQMERVRYSAHPTTISLFFNVVFLLLVVTLVNAGIGRLWARVTRLSPALARRWPRLELERGELLVIYAMLAVASTLAAH